MPAKNFLKIDQKEKLQKALKENGHPDIRERVLLFLLLNDGKRKLKLPIFSLCSLRKVAYWCVHGDPENLESLVDERMKGNYQKVTEEYVKLLLETIEKEPEELGYEFGTWTNARLSIYLEEKIGIKLSSGQIINILKKNKYSYIWAKYSLEEKQGSKKREAFKEKLEGYIKITKENPKLMQVWFLDESGFSLRVIRRKCWGKKGKRKRLAGQRRRGRVNVMGLLRYSDKKRFVEFVKKGNSEIFYEVMQVFYKEAIKEWVEAGNEAEDFKGKGPEIVIILDNASFHKKAEIINKIKEEIPKIHLEYLPAYIPDYNLIELVWHSTKEYLAHRLFKSVEELETVLNNLLKVGGLVIKWNRKLKNKGNAINAI